MPAKKQQKNKLPFGSSKPQGAYARQYLSKWELECLTELADRKKLAADLDLNDFSIDDLQNKLEDIKVEVSLAKQAASLDKHDQEYRRLQAEQLELRQALDGKAEDCDRLLEDMKMNKPSARLLDALDAEFSLFGNVKDVLDSRFSQLETQLRSREEKLKEQDAQLIANASNLTEESSRLRREKDDALAKQKTRLNREHDRMLQDAVSSAQRELESAHQNELLDAQAAAETAESDLRAELHRQYDAELSLAKDLMWGVFEQDASNQLSAELDSLRSELVIDYNQRLGNKEIEWENAEKKLRSSISTDKALAVQAAEHALRVELGTEHDRKLSDQKTQLEREKASAVQTAEDNLRTKLETKHQNKLNEQKTRLESEKFSAVQTAKDNLRNELETEHQNKLNEQKTQLENEKTSAVQTAKDNLRAELDTENENKRDEQKRQFETEKADAIKTAEDNLRIQLGRDHGKDVTAKVNAAKNRAEQQLKKRHELDIAEVKRAAEVATQKLRTSLSNLQGDLDKANDALGTVHQGRQALQQRHDVFLNRMADALQIGRTSAKSKNETEVAQALRHQRFYDDAIFRAEQNSIYRKEVEHHWDTHQRMVKKRVDTGIVMHEKLVKAEQPATTLMDSMDEWERHLQAVDAFLSPASK